MFIVDALEKARIFVMCFIEILANLKPNFSIQYGIHVFCSEFIMESVFYISNKKWLTANKTRFSMSLEVLKEYDFFWVSDALKNLSSAKFSHYPANALAYKN